MIHNIKMETKRTERDTGEQERTKENGIERYEGIMKREA
jgi:hypothetical protein